MIKYSCPYCKCKLDIKDEWQGSECICPKCSQTFVVPVVPTVSAENSGKSKWIIMIACCGIVLIAIIVALFSSPAERDVEKELRAAFSLPEPDLAQVAVLIQKSRFAQDYQASFMDLLNRRLKEATSDYDRFMVYEAVKGIEWPWIGEQRRSFISNVNTEFDQAVYRLDIERVKKLYPVAQKLDFKNLGLGKIVMESEKVYLRRSPEEMREFIDKCPDPELRGRLRNLMMRDARQQISRLNHEFGMSMAMGNLPGAEKAYAELKKIDPKNKSLPQMHASLERARKSPRPTHGIVAPPAGSRHVPKRRDFRGGAAPRRRGPPVEFQLLRACVKGQRSDVVELMKQKPDLHRVITVQSSGGMKKLAVFTQLLERGTRMGPQQAVQYKACLVAILEGGFKPNEAEVNYMKKHYPDLVQFIR